MADGDVLGILLLARNASLPSCQVCTVISPFQTFWISPSEAVPLLTRPAPAISKVLDISAFRLLQFCAGFRCLLGPWNETIEESDLVQNYGILRQNDPNFPSQSSYWCLSPRNFGCPIIGAIPNESLDFKALNRAFSRPSRSLFGGGACAKSNSLNVH